MTWSIGTTELKIGPTRFFRIKPLGAQIPNSVYIHGCTGSHLANYKLMAGGPNQACRGTGGSNDNDAALFTVLSNSQSNVEACAKQCAASVTSCGGFEFHRPSGRCELWKDSPATTVNVAGYDCYSRGPPTRHYNLTPILFYD